MPGWSPAVVAPSGGHATITFCGLQSPIRLLSMVAEREEIVILRVGPIGRSVRQKHDCS